MKLSESNFNGYLKKLKYYVEKDGPEKEEWEDYNELFNHIYYDYLNNKLTDEDMKEIYKVLAIPYAQNTLQGHAHSQPFGYPGDYLLIDKFYTHKINKEHIKWDNFVINSPAAKALINRIDYFISSISNCNSVNEISVLDIASGPCRDIKQYFDKNNGSNVCFDCVEFDINAINYAKSILDGSSDKVNFIHKNALRFTTEKKYDLIWSGGLFDYFDDKVFIRLLKRFSSFLKNNGELIFGNFSPENPSKAYMEILKWQLNYRDKKQLFKIAKQTGLNMKNVWVSSEPLGINLFLHYRK